MSVENNSTIEQSRNIPNGWVETTLGEVASKMYSGGTPSTKKSEFYGGNIPWIRTQEVTFNFISETEIKITEDGLNKSSAKWIPKDTVIIAMYGNSAGRVALSKIEATTNQACCNFIANMKLSDSYFIFYNLLSRYREIEGKANGAAQQNLSVGVLKSLPINLPPLQEQKAIAKILTAFDDKIELLQAQNKTLETTAQTIFKEWFGKYQIGDELPDGWRVGKLSEIADFLNGLALQKYPPIAGEETLPVIKIRELKQGITSNTDKANTHLDEKYIIQNGDILFSWSGSLEVVIWQNGKGALNQHLFKVSSQEFPKWFYYFWIINHLRDFKGVAANKATTMGHINRKHLDLAQVIIPNEVSFKKYNQTFNPLIEKLENNHQQIQTLKQTRDTLLPKLMSGTLRVKQ